MVIREDCPTVKRHKNQADKKKQKNKQTNKKKIPPKMIIEYGGIVSILVPGYAEGSIWLGPTVPDWS